jgi:hypothetical protein
MRRRACIGSLLLGVLLSGPTLALNKCPSESGVDNYYRFLSEQVLNRTPGQPTFLFLAMPSFDEEYGLVVSKVGPKYILTAVTFKGSVWYGAVEETSPGEFMQRFSPDKVKARVTKVELDPTIGKSLTDLTKVEIEASLPHPDDGVSGLDGETYQLTQLSGGCIETWSPEKGGRDYEIVSVLDDLHGSTWIPTQLLRTWWQERLVRKWRNAPRRNVAQQTHAARRDP